MRPVNGNGSRRGDELCVPLGTFETADVKGRPPRQGPQRAPGPALPILPYDSAERALALVETLAAAIVAQYGAQAALALASWLDEAVADDRR